VGRIERYVDPGWDDTPQRLEDFLPIYEECRSLASVLDCFLVVGLGSPTGWDPEVIRTLEGTKGAYSPHHEKVAVLLTDLETGNVSFQRNHSLAQAYALFFAPKVLEERSEEIQRFVKSRLNEVDSLSVSQVALEMGFPPHEIIEGFRRLEASGGYKVYNIESIGLVISRV
jgi:hypothetical protein